MWPSALVVSCLFGAVVSSTVAFEHVKTSRTHPTRDAANDTKHRGSDVMRRIAILPWAATQNRKFSGNPVDSTTVQHPSKSTRGLDILRSSFDYMDSVMVMSPPLKITLNNSPQKNDSLFRVSRSSYRPSAKSGKKLDILRPSIGNIDSVKVMSAPLKITLNSSPQKNDSLFRISRSTEQSSIKSSKKLDILRSSFDRFDSVMVMSPPLRITLNNSPQKNDSLFRVSRNDEDHRFEINKSHTEPKVLPSKWNVTSEGNVEIPNLNTTNAVNVSNSTRYFGHLKSNDTPNQRNRREAVYSEYNGNYSTSYPNHHSGEHGGHNSYSSGYSVDSYSSSNSHLKPVSPVAVISSRHTHRHWPREFISYLLVPVMLFLGYAPLALTALKLLVYKGIIFSKLALLAAIYMGLRNLIFGMPDTPVKYYNFGYTNDYMNQLPDTTEQS